MSARPTVTPNSLPTVKLLSVQLMVCSGLTTAFIRTWYLVFFFTFFPHHVPRWNASMYWVLPRSMLPFLKSTPDWNSGDATVFAVTVLPFETLCLLGSKVMFPWFLSKTNLTGIIQTVVVVVTLVLEGSVPTMVKLTLLCIRSVKPPFHCTSCLPGTWLGFAGCCGPAVNAGTGFG